MPYGWNKPPQTMRTQTMQNAQDAAKTQRADTSGQRAGLSPEDIQKIATQVAEAIQAGDYPAELKNLGRNVRPAVQAKLRSKNQAQTLADAMASGTIPAETGNLGRNVAPLVAAELAKRKKPR